MIEHPRWNLPSSNTFTLENGQLHLWLIELGNDQKSISSCLSSDELSRAAKFADGKKAQNFTAARSAVREILGSYLQVPAREIIFGYGPLGKPEINSPETDLRFNLSHSGSLALLAVTRATQVGIDIEPLRERSGILGIAKRIFREETFVYLSSLPKEHLIEEFLLLWTALEARAKALGQGVFSKPTADTTCVNFRPVEGWIAAVATNSGIPPQKEWYLFKFLEEHFID